MYTILPTRALNLQKCLTHKGKPSQRRTAISDYLLFRIVLEEVIDIAVRQAFNSAITAIISRK